MSLENDELMKREIIREIVSRDIEQMFRVMRGYTCEKTCSDKEADSYHAKFKSPQNLHA